MVFSPYVSSDVGCKTVANQIKGLSTEEIREKFHIKNDFTPEEEVRYFSVPLQYTILTSFLLFLPLNVDPNS